MKAANLFPFLSWLPAVRPRSLGRDALVGLTGAILALPQSIAYALIAGLPAEYGLYAAVVPVIIACLWGSSRHLICGPTAAISVVLFASVSPLALPGTQDYVVEVRGYGDHFAGAPVPPESVALTDGTTHADLATAVSRLPAGGRVLVDGDAHPDPRTWLVAPLMVGASVVLCRNLDPAKLEARLASEHAIPLP